MGIDNDTRGWIMTCISGVGTSYCILRTLRPALTQEACVLGASIICIDVVVRLFPGMQDFAIAESNAFLSASLSLSFGVMVYTPGGPIPDRLLIPAK